MSEEPYDPNEWEFLGGTRERRGVTQKELAEAVGTSLRNYKRLEQGLINDPGIRLLHNCAIALGVSLYEIIPARLRSWKNFRGDRPLPPEWETFFDHEDPRFDWDITVASVVDYADMEHRWWDDRIEGLIRKAEENDKPWPLPLHRLPPGRAIDPRLEPIEQVLGEALYNANEQRISPEDLLFALAQLDGPAADLLDELGVRDKIIERLATDHG